MRKSTVAMIAFLLVAVTASSQQTDFRKDKHRPQFHFSPKKFWMNDPNGMVYYNGTYHLFFQHYPEKTVWGPMHWGHATSKDMILWVEQPIALYPDSLGWIFSGSAVIDFNNTSGFGKNGKPPMVAIFTHHNDPLEKLKQNNHQYQSIAYSLDEGKTWTKYAGNPVLKSPGIPDFRDPKVMWYEESKNWIMTLAVKDRIQFYSSPDLKKWTMLSEFGEKFGAHGGVWECPDLFQLSYENGKKWVLLVSINPGGPNSGSVTQYFTGEFDGRVFNPTDTLTRWMDVGPDNYAGVTFSNTGNRRILMGWMSNWDYANEVPTREWRSAMTIPRELGLTNISGKPILTSKPVDETKVLLGKQFKAPSIKINGTYDLGSKAGSNLKGLYQLYFEADADSDVRVKLSNNVNQYVTIGYDHGKNEFYIDRTNSGQQIFNKNFFKRSVATRNSKAQKIKMNLFVDHASAELFADDGTTVMTAIFFPDEIFKKLVVESKGEIENVIISELKTLQE
ncbi:glycoside hydrolase family 32 protein [Flavitalea sp.]|nr:glycoside hydrolase family 32 protein [Flavitalea sp.]